MKKSTTKRLKRKKQLADKNDVVFVGLDVHKVSVHAAVRINGKETRYAVMGAAPGGVASFLEPYTKARLKVVYEAGPTGFGLARHLMAQGIDTIVAAPTRIPRACNPLAKSDKLDCKKLALYLETGLLKAIAIPSEQEQADRQLLRIRNHLIDQRRKVKQRIKALLLLHGLPEPAGLATWTRVSVRELSKLTAVPELKLSLDFLLEEYWHFEDQFLRLNKHLKKLMEEKRHAENSRRLQTHPGVGKVVALQVLMELNQPRRFNNAKQVTAYAGLAPRIRQSGDTRREGAVVNTGRPNLRANLTEGAWIWIRKDPGAKKTYGRLVRNTGSAKKAIIGMARRMLTNLWTMMIRQEDYRPVRA